MGTENPQTRSPTLRDMNTKSDPVKDFSLGGLIYTISPYIYLTPNQANE